jgi:2-oxoglutarate ferredoxin oxidoreductase subunit beta
MAEPLTNQDRDLVHPLDDLLRTDRMPHIWCSGCGIGTAFSSCLQAIKASGVDIDKTVIVSGIGCSGRVAGYARMDSFHTTHGRAIPFATGMKVANPGLNMIVFSGDGDLFAIGGNHFIHAARRNIDMTVICINNLNYGMTGGQVAATTPNQARTTTTPSGNPESPFNLAFLAWASGATYVARWTILHTRDIKESVVRCLQRKGLSFIEVLAPCPVNYGRRNKEKPLDTLAIYQNMTVIKNGISPADATVDMKKGIVLGTFIDEDRPTWQDMYDRLYRKE